MTPRRIIYGLCSLLIAAIIGITLSNTVFATGEKWMWTGNDEIDVTGGVFGTTSLKFTSSNNNDSTHPEFKNTLSNDIVLNSQACIGKTRGSLISDDVNNQGNCNQAAPPGSLEKCKDNKQGNAIAGCEKIFIVQCTIPKGTALIIKVDNTANTAKVTSNPQGTLTDISNFHTGSYPCSIPAIDDVIQNKRGGNAVNDSLDQALDSDKDRLIDEYIKQQCGPTPDPACADKMRQTMATVYDTCTRANAAMAVDTPAAAQAKTEAIATCVFNATKLHVDVDTVMSGVLSVPDYVKEKSSCSLELIGWIACPVIRFMGNLADNAFSALEDLLTVRPLNRGTKAGDSLFLAWSLMRNIANVLFVVAFMVVIYSQLTGFGIDNYGIKKLLPRIIVAAILVNASFYIAVILVDLSNIVGHSLYSILHDYSQNLLNGSQYIGYEQEGGWSKVIESILVPTGIATAGALIITTATLYASFAALVPLLTSVILALLTAIIILVGRQAFIVILIIVTPVAFVAYLLPNTQKWFNLWQKTFVGLLLLYPIIGFIYGGSYLAGIVVMNSAGSRSGVNAALLQLFGMSISALPLFITPIIIKFGGGVLNRFGGRVRNNGMFKKANKKAEGYAERKKDQRDLRALQRFGDNKRSGIGGLRDKAIQRRYKKDAIRNIRNQQLNQATASHINDYITGQEGSGGDKTSLYERAKAGIKNRNDQPNESPTYDPKTKGQKFAESMAKGGDDGAINRAMAAAINDRMHIDYEETAQAKKILLERFSSDDVDSLKNIVAGHDMSHSSAADRQAAVEIIAEQHPSDMADLVKEASRDTMDGRLRYAVARNAMKNKTSPLYSNPEVIKTIINGGVQVSPTHFQPLTAQTYHQQIVAPSINSGNTTALQLAQSSRSDLADINKAVDDGLITHPQNIAAQANQALTNTYTQAHITGEALPELQHLAQRR